MSYCPGWIQHERFGFLELLKWRVTGAHRERTKVAESNLGYVHPGSEARRQSQAVQEWVLETQKKAIRSYTPVTDPIYTYFQVVESPELTKLLDDSSILDALCDIKSAIPQLFPDCAIRLSAFDYPDAEEQSSPQLLVEPLFPGSAEQALEKYPALYELADGWSPRASAAITFSVEYI